MKRESLLWICAFLLTVAGLSSCSSDDDDIVSNPEQIVGNWIASHRSKNPELYDTADMWNFTFNADGTGCGPYEKSFRYEIKENWVTLYLQNDETILGQKYKIVSISKDQMEWDENPSEYRSGIYLKFYRKE